MAVLRAFDGPGVVAVFEDSGVGAWNDFDAPRNAPAKDPANHLSDVLFHSEFDYFALAVPRQLVSVTHAALATATTTTTGTYPNVAFKGAYRTADILLVSHGLGVVPRYMISYLGARLPAGRRIQTASLGGRIVQHYATSTGIYLREFAFAGTADLPAMAADYDVRVFDVPAADPDAPLIKFDGSALSLGKGKVSSAKTYLRRTLPAESGFDFNLGLTGAVRNGGARIVSGGNIIDDNGYSGAFAGPAFVAVT